MIEALVEQIESRFGEVGRLITDPDVIRYRRPYAEVGREYRRLQPAAKLAEEGRRATDDAAGARELLAEEWLSAATEVPVAREMLAEGEDTDLRELLRVSEARIEELEEEIRLA